MSPRAKKFSKVFNAEKVRCGFTLPEIAEKTGLSYSTLKTYSQGRRIPLPESAEQLDFAFNSEKCTAFLRVARKCKTCDKKFYLTSRGEARFCSDICSRFKNRKDRAENEMQRRAYELGRYHESVHAHCMDCIGSDLTCPDAACKLRQVSPVPLPERKPNEDRPTLEHLRLVSFPYVDGPVQRVSEQ